MVNEPTSIDGKTPLYIANENKKIKVVNYLKSESIDAFKYTNIFDAAKNGNNKEMVSLLFYWTSIGRVPLAWDSVVYLRKLRLKYLAGPCI